MGSSKHPWNIKFDQVIKLYGFEKSPDEPCVYKKIQGLVVVFLVLYVDDILLIGNSVKVLSDVKGYLKKQFDMKDLGEANYILGIKLLRDRKNKVLALSQASYIDKIVTRFGMENSKRGLLPFRHGIHLSKEQSPKTPEEKELMSKKPYASVVDSLMYAMLCTRPYICYAVGVVSRYQADPGVEHWTTVKHILKYLKRTMDYMLVYSSGSLKHLVIRTHIFKGILTRVNQHQDMCLPEMGEPFVRRALNRLVLLTPRLKLNMWLHLKLQRKLYGLRNSFWIFM